MSTAVGSTPVLLLPGILTPASLRYRALIAELGDDVRAVTKELEVYRGPIVPPAGYGLQTELEGIGRAADEAGFERFHLYGYSGGGACALAFVASHPERVVSLALDEPATDFADEDLAEIRGLRRAVLATPAPDRVEAFARRMLRSGVDPPPRSGGSTPAWMADRPAGIEAFTLALTEASVARDRLRAFERPVAYTYGSLSAESWQRRAERLAETFPNFTVERFEGLSHLNASHEAEPGRVAALLRKLWATSPGRSRRP